MRIPSTQDVCASTSRGDILAVLAIMKLTNRKLVGLAVLGILAYAAPAYAYVDPGVGSILLQGLIAGIGGAVIILKLYWRRLRARFSSSFSATKAFEQRPDSSKQSPNSKKD